MRTLLTHRWLLLLVLVALVAAGSGPRPAHATPHQQTLTILALGFVDVFGGSDPNCPGCNGEYDPEDEQEAMNDPLPSMTFVVLDAGGAELDRQQSTPLAGLQRATFEVPELPEYTLVLETDPAGWTLCSNESRRRQLTQDDFQLGSTREDFHFTKGCLQGETPTPEPTVPGGPTAPPPGDTPDPGDDDEQKEPFERLGAIHGLAFIDLNQDGKLGPDEPGLNDVAVHLAGGGLDLVQLSRVTGQYSFDGLGTGEYDLFISPGPEWRVTTPSKYSAVHVDRNTVMGIDFGLVRVGPPAAAPAAPRLVAPAPGAGIRLPSAGIANLPVSGTLGLLGLVLGALAVLGIAVERRNGAR